MHNTPVPETYIPAAKPKKSFGRRVFKTLFWMLALAFLVVVGSSLVIAAFFEDKVSERLLSEINKQLKTEITVKEFNLSLLSGFPHASANLNSVVLKDTKGKNLLEAQNMAFRFKLLSLFSSKIKVNSILVQNGALFINIDKRGAANYNIVKDRGSESKSGSDLAISLEEARFEDVELIFVDERIKQEVKMLIKKAYSSGDFSTERFNMSSIAELRSEFIETKNGRFLIGKDLVYNADLDVDFKNRKYALKEIDVGIENSVFTVDGTIASKGKNTDLDLMIHSKDGSIASLVDLLPEKQLAYFKDFQSDGRFYLNASVKGRLNDVETPDVKADFGLKDGKISSKKLRRSFKDVKLEGTYSNGKYNNLKTTVFNIKQLKGYFNRELIESSLLVSNLESPKIDFKLDGVLPLSSVHGLLNIPNITDGEGEIEIKNLRIKGRYKDMITPGRIEHVTTSGELEFDDAGLTINGEDLVFDKGSVKLKGNSLLVNNIKIEGAGSEIILNGKFLNLLPVVFADAKNTKKARLKFTASLESPTLDVDKFIKVFEKPLSLSTKKKSEVDSLKTAQVQDRKKLTSFLEGSFNADIKEYNYRKIEGEDFVGKLIFKNNTLNIKGKTNAMDGRFDLDGNLYFKDQPKLICKVNCEEIDVHQFFEQCENFGQTVVQEKHVNGTLEARLLVNAFWDEKGNFNYDDLNVFGDVRIVDGELVDFEMLYTFSDYIKIKDLEHIKFTELRNWLEVKKRKVYIPTMYIQSNAMNMTLSGSHSFDKKIDYNMMINATQVLFNKFKKHDPGLKPIKPEKKGWFNLFYHVYGKTNNFKVKKDKRHVKRRFAQGEQMKMGIKAELRRAFGNIKPLAMTPVIEEQIDETEIIFEEETTLPAEDEEIVLSGPEPEEVESIPGISDKPTTPVEDEEDDTEYLDFEFEGVNKPKEKKDNGGGGH